MLVSRRGLLASLIAVPVVAPVVAKALDSPSTSAPNLHPYHHLSASVVLTQVGLPPSARCSDDLRPGDLVFWCSDHPKQVCHGEHPGARVVGVATSDRLIREVVVYSPSTARS